MDEGPGKIQEASAHVVSFIVMDVAIVESHHCAAAPNVNASALTNKEGKCHGTFIQRGDGRRFRESLEGEHSRRPARTRYKIGKVRERSSNGVMEDDSGNVLKASTHVAKLSKREAND